MPNPVSEDKIRSQEAKEAFSEHTDIPKPRARRGNDARLREQLVQFYGSLGMGITGVGMGTGRTALAATGINVGDRAEATADAWMELADQNPAVKEWLQRFVTGSTFAEIAFAHVSMIVPVLAAQELVPPYLGDMFMSDNAKMFLMTQRQAEQAKQASTNGTPPVS